MKIKFLSQSSGPGQVVSHSPVCTPTVLKPGCKILRWGLKALVRALADKSPSMDKRHSERSDGVLDDGFCGGDGDIRVFGSNVVYSISSTMLLLLLLLLLAVVVMLVVAAVTVQIVIGTGKRCRGLCVLLHPQSFKWRVDLWMDLCCHWLFMTSWARGCVPNYSNSEALKFQIHQFLTNMYHVQRIRGLYYFQTVQYP